jgi:hypothetical protein
VKTRIDDILIDEAVRVEAAGIGAELNNRNQSVMLYFHQYLGGSSELAQQCNRLLSYVQNELNSFDMGAIDTTHRWLIFHSQDSNEKIDIKKLAVNMCVLAIKDSLPNLEKTIEALDDTSLVRSLDLEVDKHGLTSLNNPRLELLHHGVGVDEVDLIYLHPFMRRYYTSNFVDLPAYLRNEVNANNKVSVRIDPGRLSERKYHQDLVEADYWHGPKFSDAVLYDTRLSSRTLHSSRGPMDTSYDVRFTVIRTKMMDEGLREFSIEEYCSISRIDGGGEYSPGFSPSKCIQKFGHFVFDQNVGSFNHVDGAVRVLDTEHYEGLYADIQAGKDVDDKVGDRKKMFLVEGVIPVERISSLMAEWFRYNSLVIEYFTGEDVAPFCTYEQLATLDRGNR